MNNLDDIKTEAQRLVGMYSGRDKIFDEQERAYFVRPKSTTSTVRTGTTASTQDEWNQPKAGAGSHTRYVYSPDPANRLRGAVRLLGTTKPKFRFAFENEGGMSEGTSNALEKVADQWWLEAGQVLGTPVHHDIILSGLLYDNAVAAVWSTAELLKRTPASAPNRKRIERLSARTPYLYRVYSPRQCYVRRDWYGISGWLRRVSTPVYKVRADYGDEAEAALAEKKSDELIDLYEWWDEEMQAVWIDEDGQKIRMLEHGLSTIPVADATPEGSSQLFDRMDDILRPFMYSFVQSGMWDAQNSALTVASTMAFAIGANPQFLYVALDQDKGLQTDFSVPGGLTTIQTGESYGPLAKQVIDPSIFQVKTIADAALNESTIYSQALGQPLGSNAAYSMVALLNQAGRLPLAGPQERLGNMIARLMEISVDWWREEGKAYKYLAGGRTQELSPANIPEDFRVTAELTINLPQDKLQAANIASILGDKGYVSKEWIQENLLDVGQPSDMWRQINTERIEQMLFESDVQRLIAERMRKMQEEMAKAGAINAGGAPQFSEPTQTQAPTGIPPVMLEGGMQGPAPLPGEAPEELPV